MKLELNTLLTAQQALGTLGNTKGLSSVVAYRISKNIKAVSKEIEDYEESRKKLLEEHSNKDDEGNVIIKDDNTYDVIDGHMEIINKELDKLKKEEVELDIKKINIFDIDKAGLSPFELETIEFMINFEEEN